MVNNPKPHSHRPGIPSWFGKTSQETSSPTQSRCSLPPYHSIVDYPRPEISVTASEELMPSPFVANKVSIGMAGRAPGAGYKDVEPVMEDTGTVVASRQRHRRKYQASRLVKRPLSSIDKYASKRMLAPFLLGCAFAVGQKLFIRQAAGKYVQTYSIPELWMRAIANILASLAQFFFLAAMTSAIHQMIWWFIRRKRSFMVAQLNVLFSQPSSYLSLTSYPRIFSDLPALLVILLSVTVVQLTNIFGAAALQTIPAPPQIVSLPVPGMAWADWSGGQAVGNGISNDSIQMVFTGPSMAWTNIVRSSLMTDHAAIPPAPPNCSTGCSYNITYAAPALSCEAGERAVLPSNTLFASTFEGGRLDVTWASATSDGQAGALMTACAFVEGNYSVMVHNVAPLFYSIPQVLSTGDSIPSTWPMSSNTSVQVRNYASFATAFANALSGSVTQVPVSGLIDSTTLAPSTVLFAINDTVAPSRFDVASDANIPTALEELFANTTSAFVGRQGAQQTVQVAVLPPPGATIYVVRTMVLRLTYLFSAGLTLVSCALGYICLRRNQVVRRNCFSAFMEATYRPELAQVAQLAQTDRPRFYTSKLILSPATGAFAPDSR